MIKEELEKKLAQVAALSKGSKFSRLLSNPFKYTYAIFLKNALYPIFQNETKVTCKLFTGKKMKVILPASTDIFITGGKSHSSEIRLATFLIKNLEKNETFWDIGAHYGYFSLLASELVGDGGQVISIEAAPRTFEILKENAVSIRNISILNNAVADNNEKISFYELPNLYSEYNSTDLTQFENEKWFAKIKSKKVTIDAITLNELLDKYKRIPAVIKIDVEGGEAAVINGGLAFLKEHSPIIVMEYLESTRANEPHRKASKLLMDLAYQPYIIMEDGSLKVTANIEEHLSKQNLESDNIVFKKY